MANKAAEKHGVIRNFRRRTDRDGAPYDVGEEPGEAEIRFALELTGLGIFDYYPLTDEMHWSAAAKKHFGLSPDAHVNYNVFLAGIHPEDRERVGRIVRAALQREDEGKYSTDYRTVGIEDRKERWIAARGQAFFNRAGEAIRLIGTTEDITERRRVDEAAKVSEEHYQLLFDKSPLPKLVFDLETLAFLEVNEEAVKHYDFSQEEFRAMTLRDLGAPGELKNYEAWLKDATSAGRKFEGRVQTKQRKKNDEIIDVDVRYTQIERQGRKAGLAVVVDFTERKRASDALREIEQRYSALFNARMNGIAHIRVIADEQGKPANLAVQEINEGYEKITGVRKEDIEGKKITDAFPGIENASYDFIGEWGRVGLEGGELNVETFFEPTGQWYSIYVYSPKRGEVTAMLSDISARKKAEEELVRTVEELERSNKELQQFAYIASHDLQEPLRTVASYLDLLSAKYKGKLDEKADRYISFAAEGANHMSVLISDLLLFSRVGTRGLTFTDVDMDSVFTQATSNLTRAIRESNAAVTADSLPHVKGDDTQLVQLLQNLIANAIKFRKKDEKPRIHVSVERKGNEWVFGVHDNGIGIEPRFYDRIFMIFQRLHTRAEYPGTGVGLAICKRIVERHGGRIWLESKPGEGTTFYFALPAKEERRAKSGELAES